MNPDDGGVSQTVDPDKTSESTGSLTSSPLIPDQPIETVSIEPILPNLAEKEAVIKSEGLLNSEPTQSTPQEPASSVTGVPPSKVKNPGTAKKRRLMMLIMLAVFLVAGGSAAAYQGLVVPNKPNNVVVKVLSKIVDRKGPGGFAINVNTSSGGENTPASSVSINGSIDKDDNIRADLGITVSAFKLTASTIVRTNDKVLYVKVNELPSLLQLLGGDANIMLGTIVTKLDKNWVKIDIDGLNQAGLLSHEQANTSNSCLAAYSDYVKTQKDQIDSLVSKAYKKHMFINATKAGKDTVDGVMTTKYKLDVKRDIAKNFVNELNAAATSSNKALIAACGDKTNRSTKSDTALDQSLAETKIDNVYMWVTGSKELAKLSATVTENGSKVDVALKLNDKLLDASAPTNVITIKELTDDYHALIGGSLSSPSDFLTL